MCVCVYIYIYIYIYTPGCKKEPDYLDFGKQRPRLQNATNLGCLTLLVQKLGIEITCSNM